MRYRPSVPFVAFWPKQITPRWQVRSSLQRLCERAPFLLLFMRQEGRCCASLFVRVREVIVDKTQNESDSDNEQEVQLAIEVGSINI